MKIQTLEDLPVLNRLLTVGYGCGLDAETLVLWHWEGYLFHTGVSQRATIHDENVAELLSGVWVRALLSNGTDFLVVAIYGWGDPEWSCASDFVGPTVNTELHTPEERRKAWPEFKAVFDILESVDWDIAEFELAQVDLPAHS